MTRAVDDPMTLPGGPTIARATIRSDDGTVGGLSRLYSTSNTLYSQRRGALVCDAFGTSGLSTGILDSNGETARYEVRIDGVDGLVHNLKPYIYYHLDTGSFDIDVNSYDSDHSTADGTSSQTVSATTTGGWLALANCSLTADSYYKMVEVTITAEAGGPTYAVESIMVLWDQTVSALTAVTAGQAGYSDGFVPIEVSQADDNKPVSSFRLHHLNKNTIIEYEEKQGSVLCASWPAAAGFSFALEIPVAIPRDVTSLTVAFRAKEAAGVGYSGDVTITVTAGSTEDSFTTTILGPGYGWYRGQLDVTEGVEDTITFSSAGSEAPNYDALSIYYENASYG
jgi:hypothetical protein